MKQSKVKQMRLKVFNIETYRNCEIEAENYQRKFICMFPKGDCFEFSIDTDRSQLKVEFQVIYKDQNGKGVVMYRGEPNSHIHAFWIDLGNEYHKRNHGYQDALRDRVLSEFDFNWENK